METYNLYVIMHNDFQRVNFYNKNVNEANIKDIVFDYLIKAQINDALVTFYIGNGYDHTLVDAYDLVNKKFNEIVKGLKYKSFLEE